MASKIDHRFLFDTFFFEEILKNSPKAIPDLAYKLAYITSKSSGNKKKHNLMSAKTRDELIKRNPSLSIENVRIFLNKLDDAPEIIESENDEITRNLRFAVYLTYMYPYKVMLFTSKEKIEEYKKNKHYPNVDNVKLICDADATQIINYWFSKCREEKSSTCD